MSHIIPRVILKQWAEENPLGIVHVKQGSVWQPSTVLAAYNNNREARAIH